MLARHGTILFCMALQPKYLANRVVLITGGAKRLGRAAALSFSAAGATVAITYLRSKNEAEETLQKIGHIGGKGIAVRCDVKDLSSVRKAVGTVVRRLGGIDVLINNAGTYETVAFDELEVEQWDEIFATNVRGPFLVSKEALPHLRARRGRIVNLGSLGGLRAWATHAHYCSSKAALHMLTKAMAKALAPDVAVNCVAPGMIDSGDPKAASFMRRMAKLTPMQRNGTEDEIAAAVLFFATAPHFITGQILCVDGGLGL